MLRKIKYIVSASIFLIICHAQAFDLTLHDTPASIYFSPHGGAQVALVHRIDQARESIFVLAYSFTSAPVADALIQAQRRGVQVQAILDRSQRKARSSKGQALAAAGAGVYIDARHALAHNKVMVIDGHTVVTGSFNFTKAAETRNAENLLILDSPELARLYREEWEKHWWRCERWR